MRYNTSTVKTNCFLSELAAKSFPLARVETGSSGDGRIEIVRGLKEGEPVVSKGAFAVKSVLLGKQLQEDKE